MNSEHEEAIRDYMNETLLIDDFSFDHINNYSYRAYITVIRSAEKDIREGKTRQSIIDSPIIQQKLNNQMDHPEFIEWFFEKQYAWYKLDNGLSFLSRHLLKLYFSKENRKQTYYEKLSNLNNIIFKTHIMSNMNCIPNNIFEDVLNQFIPILENSEFTDVSWLLKDSRLPWHVISCIINFAQFEHQLPSGFINSFFNIFHNENLTSDQITEVCSIIKKRMYNDYRVLEMLSAKNINHKHIINELQIEGTAYFSILRNNIPYTRKLIKLVEKMPITEQALIAERFPFLTNYGITVTPLEVAIEGLKSI